MRKMKTWKGEANGSVYHFFIPSFLLQEAATSTQEGSSDSQSSAEEKIIIALHKDTEQSDIVISEQMDEIKPEPTNHVAKE